MSGSDESKLWHKRLGHSNFKTMNILVKGNLVRGLPSKSFENSQECIACQKGKQHRASCKSKTKNSISLPLHLLHMDLFGPTFVKSLMKKMYCLVVTDDYSRYETSKYGYAPSRPADLMDGPLIARIREIHSNDKEGVPMAKVGRLCILKKEIAPLLQVVTSYSSPELMELTDAEHSLPHLSCLPTMLIKMEDLISNLSLETFVVEMGNVFRCLDWLLLLETYAP
nr:putative ribonuclease H-like domain-containing protein [Tanacetum cinerariifolium]